MNIKQYLTAHRDYCRAELIDNIFPFWLEHGLDRENGGVYTCLDRDGTLMDSTKSVWFQGRFGFTTAFAYNNIEQRPEWLEASRSCIDFNDAHCFDTDGHMFFEVMADGTPLRKRRYVFSEGFAAIANSEYSLATGERKYAERAVEIFESIIRMLNTPGFLEAKYLPTQESRGHSITMILVNTAARIREAVERFGMEAPLQLPPIGGVPVPSMTPWEFLTGEIDKSIHALRTYFMHPEYKALLECVGPNGEFIDNINGRLINPGHCIETAWFILEEAKYRARKVSDGTWPASFPMGELTEKGWPKDLVDMGLTILDWSWQWGWDEQYGGIINFRDCKGFPQQDYSQDMKFWWPQCETMIAMLYAFQATGDEAYLHRHQQMTEWTLGHFPDRECGEWYGYLHRDGTVAQPAKGNIFKGPFHVPRMFVKSHMLCEELLKAEA